MRLLEKPPTTNGKYLLFEFKNIYCCLYRAGCLANYSLLFAKVTQMICFDIECHGFHETEAGGKQSGRVQRLFVQFALFAVDVDRM